MLIHALKKGKWSPYSSGALIGLLAMASLIFFHKTLGTSTSFVKLAAAIESLFHFQDLQNQSYYALYLDHKTWLDWQAMLVIGLFLGAYFSKKLSHPSKERLALKGTFDKTSSKSYLAAFVGGILLMFGARLAGGCTSGHAISGGFQLAVSGWLFMIAVFALGIPTAWILYRKK